MCKYYVNGTTLMQWCKKNGLKYYSVFYRMVEKMETPEDAIKNIRSYPLYNGKSVRQICGENEISQSSVSYRMKRKGETIEQAVAYLLERKNGKRKTN